MASNRKRKPTSNNRLSTGIRLVERRFDAAEFLAKSGVGKTLLELKKKQVLFSQGDVADSIFFVQQGRLKLTVVSKSGKEATVALLGPGDFVGEDSVAAVNSKRLATSTAITECALLRIQRAEMLRVLHQEHALSDVFCSFLLARNARIQEDLIDHMFNSAEKRLARILLLLAQFGKEGRPETVIPNLSHQMLAEMVGTTRSRVTFFMNRFRKLGFVEYNGEVQVHSSLLNVILLD